MKKQYTTPQMEVISITKPQLLTGSNLDINNSTTDTQLSPDLDFDGDAIEILY